MGGIQPSCSHSLGRRVSRECLCFCPQTSGQIVFLLYTIGVPFAATFHSREWLYTYVFPFLCVLRLRWICPDDQHHVSFLGHPSVLQLLGQNCNCHRNCHRFVCRRRRRSTRARRLPLPTAPPVMVAPCLSVLSGRWVARRPRDGRRAT